MCTIFCSVGDAGVDAGSLSAALALVFGGSMLSAVGSLERGQPVSARQSLGLSHARALRSCRRRFHRRYNLNLIILQQDRLQRATASGCDQHRNVTVRFSAMEADVRRYCWPAEMPVEGDPGCLQTHDATSRDFSGGLDVADAVSHRRYRATRPNGSTARGDSSASRVRRPSGGFGLPPGLPLVPGTQ
jgi:hypothetical protein